MEASERIEESACIYVRDSTAGEEGFQFLFFGCYRSGLQQIFCIAGSPCELAERQNRYAFRMSGRKQRRAGAEADRSREKAMTGAEQDEHILRWIAVSLGYRLEALKN